MGSDALSDIKYRPSQVKSSKPLLYIRQNIQCESKKSSMRFSDIFPKRLGIVSPNFICLLHVPIYARSQLFYSIISNCDEVMPY